MIPQATYVFSISLILKEISKNLEQLINNDRIKNILDNKTH